MSIEVHGMRLYYSIFINYNIILGSYTVDTIILCTDIKKD